MGISSRLWKIGWMLLLIPWIRFCLDTRLVSSHELVSRDMQEASLPYPTLTPPEKKKKQAKKTERKFKQWQINPPPKKKNMRDFNGILTHGLSICVSAAVLWPIELWRPIHSEQANLLSSS